MKMSAKDFQDKILINEKKMKGRVSGENQSKWKRETAVKIRIG